VDKNQPLEQQPIWVCQRDDKVVDVWRGLITRNVLAVPVLGQSSCAAPSLTYAGYPAPSVAPGYAARLVANGLQSPRSIVFDSKGRLLVVQQGLGIQALTFDDGGGECVSVKSKDDVVRDVYLNHGLEISKDGKTLYASTSDVVYSYTYDPTKVNGTSNRRTIVTGMNNTDHATRTIFLSKKVDNTLLVSRGSADNNDPGAADITTGRSQIKYFKLDSLHDTASYEYTSQGTVLGWGLRNSVGISEHPITGGIYSVENSVDSAMRDGVDIHQNNPGEEMNFHGYLNGTKYAGQGQNYGYPICFSAWNVSAIPNNAGIETGSQFAIGYPNGTSNDQLCRENRIAPRLTFPAHWAPLDIVFTANGSMAWLTSHGSWDRDEPDGYMLFALEFANGEPTHPANSTTAVIPIMKNQDNSKCPKGCFRPVSLAWDTKGRLFMSSDSTGEIYVITKSDGSSFNDVSSSTGTTSTTGTTGTSTSTGSAPAATSKKSASIALRLEWRWSLLAMLLSMVVFLW